MSDPFSPDITIRLFFLTLFLSLGVVAAFDLIHKK